jgi:hypothetical protein
MADITLGGLIGRALIEKADDFGHDTTIAIDAGSAALTVLDTLAVPENRDALMRHLVDSDVLVFVGWADGVPQYHFKAATDV